MNEADLKAKMESGMTRQEYEEHEKKQLMEQHPEDFEKLQLYLDVEFQNYVKQRYMHENGDQLYKQPQILKMIYALEWFDLPKYDQGSLVEFHPELTKGDNQRLETLN